MDRDEKRDPMHINISNVLSPHRDAHMAEMVYDVDFTENVGNSIVESSDDHSHVDNYNTEVVNALKKRRDMLQ